MIKDEPVYINADGETSRYFCYFENVVQFNLLLATVASPLPGGITSDLATLPLSRMTSCSTEELGGEGGGRPH